MESPRKGGQVSDDMVKMMREIEADLPDRPVTASEVVLLQQQRAAVELSRKLAETRVRDMPTLRDVSGWTRSEDESSATPCDNIYR